MCGEPNLLARVEAVLRAKRGIKPRRMFGGVAFLLNGNMLVGVQGNRLIVRADEAQAT